MREVLLLLIDIVCIDLNEQPNRLRGQHNEKLNKPELKSHLAAFNKHV
jgi:hypothetical protein